MWKVSVVFNLKILGLVAIFCLTLSTYAQEDVDCAEIIDPPTKVDFLMGWASKLFKDGDPAFEDPAYLVPLLESAQPDITSSYSMPPYKNKYSKLFDDFEQHLLRSSKFSLDKVIKFTQSGTDANNLLYEYANWAYKVRTTKDTKAANILYFGNVYGGTHGRIAEISSRYDIPMDTKKKFNIPAPYVSSLSPPEGEVERVKLIEEEALGFIRRQVGKDQLKIGGIFIEPVSAVNGVVNVYRNEFLFELRKLADELRVPIFADEILTGGGRTGKFWAFQHYFDSSSRQYFVPDLVTFGKGLIVSGVARGNRSTVNADGMLGRAWDFPFWSGPTSGSERTYPEVVFDNTSRANPLVLIQANWVMKNLLDREISKNAEALGQYLMNEITRRFNYLEIDTSSHSGLGLLVNVGKFGHLIVKPEYNVLDFKGRWTPPLTITKDDINELLIDIDP